MKELPKWKSVKYCPKCGKSRSFIARRHFPNWPGAFVYYRDDEDGGHMEIICFECDYSWNEECKDAKRS